MPLLPQIPRKFHLVIAVRLVSLVIQAVSYFVPDHEADAFKPRDYDWPPDPEPTPVGWALRVLLDGYHRWDSVHFVLVVRHGYAFDHSTVFFPLYPMLCRALRLPLSLLLSNPSYCLATEASVTLLACYCVNFGLHLLCVHLLWHLTEFEHPKQPVFRLVVVTLFSLSPATPFFISFYSELAHLACVLWALLCLQRSHNLEAAAALALSGLARANGVVNALLVAAPACATISTNWRRRRWQSVLSAAARSGSVSAAACAGFVGHQLLTAWAFCSESPDPAWAPGPGLAALGRSRNYSLRGSGVPPDWCSSGLLAPMSYGAVQARDWDVGLFRYYQLRQAPNFMLAAPVLALTGWAVAKAPVPRRLLGLRVQLACLAALCLATAHIQIATRLLLSASPLPYWLAASHVMLKSAANRATLERLRRLASDSPLAFLALCLRHGGQLSLGCRLLLAWCLTYAAAGTAMHANFLPWT